MAVRRTTLVCLLAAVSMSLLQIQLSDAVSLRDGALKTTKQVTKTVVNGTKPDDVDTLTGNDATDLTGNQQNQRSYNDDDDDSPNIGLIAGLTGTGFVVFVIIIPCICWCCCPECLVWSPWFGTAVY